MVVSRRVVESLVVVGTCSSRPSSRARAVVGEVPDEVSSPPPPESTTARITPPRAAAATTAASTAFFTGSEATLARPWPHTLEEQLKRLPAKPGVYLFRDERGAGALHRQGEVAAAARALVLPGQRRTRARRSSALPERVADVEVIVTDTEVEALHLEQNLVKRHRPPFNVRLRDDKSFPYIAVTVEDDYPRVMFTRERHRRGVVYFGPYANAKKVRETLDVLNRVFPYRPCEGPKPGRHSRDSVPRLPHRALPGARASATSRRRTTARSSTRDRVPLRRDAADPARARAEDEGGRRGRALRGGGALPQPPVRGAAPGRAAGGRPALGRHGRRDRARRRGRPRRGADLPAARRPADRPLRLPPRERRRARTRRRCSRRSRSSTTARRRACRRRSSSRRRRATPRALERVPLRPARLARRGARAARAARSGGCRSWRPRTRGSRSSRRWSQAERKRLRRVEALEELREALNLESLPLRIECYDISNIQGESVVGSMVVFQDAMPKKAHYRKFGVRCARRAGRLRRARGGRLAPLRAAAGRRGGRGVRRVVRGDAEPGRDRRRQGPAVGGAGGDAGATTCRAWP